MVKAVMSPVCICVIVCLVLCFFVLVDLSPGRPQDGPVALHPDSFGNPTDCSRVNASVDGFTRGGRRGHQITSASDDEGMFGRFRAFTAWFICPGGPGESNKFVQQCSRVCAVHW